MGNDGGASSGSPGSVPRRICPDCGNDEHQPGADACWKCDAPLDAAPDPQRIVARSLAGSSQVRKRVWFGASLGIMALAFTIGVWLQSIAASGATALVLAIVFVLTRRQWEGAPLSRTIGRIAGVLTLVVLLAAAAAAIGVFVLYLICLSNGGIHGHF